MTTTAGMQERPQPRRLTRFLLRVAAWRMPAAELVPFTSYLLDAEEHRARDERVVDRVREALGAIYNAFTAGGRTGASIGASGIPTAIGGLIFVLTPVPVDQSFGIAGNAAAFTMVQTIGVAALTLQCLLHPHRVRPRATVALVALPLVVSGFCFALFAPSTDQPVATLAWTATRITLLVIALGMLLVAYALSTGDHRRFLQGWKLTGLGGVGVLVPDALWASLFASRHPAWAVAFVLSAMGAYLMGNAMLHYEPAIAR